MDGVKRKNGALSAHKISFAIQLHGSVAETGSGHGIARALLGGLLGIAYAITNVSLRAFCPTTSRRAVVGQKGKPLELQSCSLGGGTPAHGH